MGAGYEVLLEVDAWVDDEVRAAGETILFNVYRLQDLYVAICADKRLLSVHLFGNWDIYIYTQSTNACISPGT